MNDNYRQEIIDLVLSRSSSNMSYNVACEKIKSRSICKQKLWSIRLKRSAPPSPNIG